MSRHSRWAHAPTRRDGRAGIKRFEGCERKEKGARRLLILAAQVRHAGGIERERNMDAGQILEREGEDQTVFLGAAIVRHIEAEGGHPTGEIAMDFIALPLQKVIGD